MLSLISKIFISLQGDSYVLNISGVTTELYMLISPVYPFPKSDKTP
jgi:hypothetical protein